MFPAMQIDGDSITVTAAAAAADIALPTLTNGNNPKWIMVNQEEASVTHGIVRCGSSTVSTITTTATGFVVPWGGYPLFINCYGNSHIGYIRSGAADAELHITPLSGDPPPYAFQQIGAGVSVTTAAGAAELAVPTFDGINAKYAVVQIEGAGDAAIRPGQTGGTAVTAATGMMVPHDGVPMVLQLAGNDVISHISIASTPEFHVVPIAW